MNFSIFRKQALTSYLRPDAPGAIVAVTPPWSFAIVGTMLALFVGLAAAATFGRAQVVASGRGVVRYDKPPIVLFARRAGKIRTITHGPRDRGAAGDALLVFDADDATASHKKCADDLDVERRDLTSFERRLAEWNGKSQDARDASTALVLLSQIRTQREKVATLASRCDVLANVVERSVVKLPVDATVVDVEVSPGAEVKEGDRLAVLAPQASRLVAYLSFPEARRSELEVGQTVRLRFDSLPSDEVGAGTGRVLAILDALPSGAKIEHAEGGGLFAEVSIDAMPSASNGSARQGMTLDGDVLTRRVPIASLVFAPNER